MHHGALANLIQWQLQHTPRGVTRTLQFASLSFDVSFQELFSTWCSGGTLVLCGEETRRDMAALCQLIRERRIHRLFLPFVALQQLAESASSLEAPVFPSLCEIITAGEQLQVTAAVASLFRRHAPMRLVNQYGPAEAHVVTAHALPGDVDLWPASPPIGRPVSNTTIYILDRWGHPAPLGVPGELYIGGLQVARGYLHRPELTAERFLPDPFSDDGGARVYRTGDLARYLSDGNIEFLGRIDGQIKIRGYRIEVGEVEALLMRHELVREAVVVAREDSPGNRRLVAYVVCSGELDVRALRGHLLQQLPEYMVPALYVPLDAFPVTPSGKIDRRSLPAPGGIGALDRPAYAEPRTETESIIASIWGEILQVSRVGADDDFFELGGHSLVATQVTARIGKHFGIELPVRRIFEAPTPGRLAEVVDTLRWATLGLEPGEGPSRAVAADIKEIEL